MAIERRQQDGGGSNTAAASNTAAGSTSAPASNTGSSVSAITSASGASASGSATSSAPHFGITGGPGFNPNATHVSIPANGNPGEIVFTQPPLQSTSYYKIAPGEYVTFGWNVSYLIVTPTAITVSAACENGNTYPVGPTDGVIPGDASSVVWYPWDYQTSHPNLPLAQAKYTLLVFAQGGPSAAATPGYLAPNSELQFAMYTPQAYTPLASGWSCGGSCGAALEQFTAHPASIALLTTLLIVFLSGFTTLRRVQD